MKRLYPLLFISVLIYWGCDDPKEEETTPTEVTLWGVVYSVTISPLIPYFNKRFSRRTFFTSTPHSVILLDLGDQRSSL